MGQVTNMDIMLAIGDLKAVTVGIQTELSAVHDQANKTNGRVNSIEQWKNALEAVDRYKEANPTQKIQHADTVVIQKRWYDSKELVRAVGIAAAAAGALVTYLTASGVLK